MRDQVRAKGRIPLEGAGLDDIYARNIQVADLNMLNAAFAVLRWKRLRGFYVDLEEEHFSLFTLDGNHLLNEDRPGEAAGALSPHSHRTFSRNRPTRRNRASLPCPTTTA